RLMSTWALLLTSHRRLCFTPPGHRDKSYHWSLPVVGLALCQRGPPRGQVDGWKHTIYERVIDPPQMEMTAGSGVWLGQHTHKHGLFKGIIQDVKLIFAPNGYISQCPNLNRTCPTCSDFLSLVQGIMDLQEVLAKMTLKLNYAESRLTQLEGCHCERMCSTNGLLYRDKELWLEPENCRNCACKDGVVECRRIFCPPANCSKDALAVHVNGTCCKKCRPKCTYMGQSFSEGQRFLSKSCRECKNGLMAKVAETCPELNCTLGDQILPDNRCCNVCKGYDFCAEGLVCGENSDCKNRNTRGECECQSGYASAHGDSTYCQGKGTAPSVSRGGATAGTPPPPAVSHSVHYHPP
ncbi:hypothetical protein NHX12_005270, partial [Muraenolepis orangiensis]